MSSFLTALRERAAAAGRRLVFPEADEDRTLDAVATIVQERLAQPILLGEPDVVRSALAQRGVAADAVVVLDPATDERREPFGAELARRRAERAVMTRDAAHVLVADPLFFGAMLVSTGAADGSVAGAVRPTADVVRAALWCVGPAPRISTVSSAFYMVVPPFRGGSEPEVLTFTDAGVVPTPSSAQLAEIAYAAVEARRRIVNDEPRVAFLSFSTKGSASGPEVTRVRQAFEMFRVRLPDVAADGELQADAALIAGIATRKAPLSPIAGNANILVFPNLDAGNIAYKLVERLAGGVAIGPILQGLARPCNDMSRGAATADIINVACMTALLA